MFLNRRFPEPAMARQSQSLTLLTVLMFFVIILLLNKYEFKSGTYYIQVEEELAWQQLKEQWPNQSQNYTDLKLDYSVTEPVTDELMKEIQKKIPSLPLEYFYRHSNRVMQKFKNCAQYPAIQVLNFYNTYWQSFYIDNSIYQLYGAYYDDRSSTGAVVRILAMTNHKQNAFPTIYCQLWFEDDSQPVLSTVTEYQMIWDKNWGVVPEVYYPYLMTCEMPKNTSITGDPTPKAINLVKHQCDTAKNSLRIIYDKPPASEKKQEVAVCVKGLDFPYKDLSARLVEWLELLNILGVHKVFMHNLQVHHNISKVLDYYQAKGFVEVRNITLVGEVVGQPELEHWLIKSYPLNRRLNELIPYNDCFYRNIYKYDYVALLDIDEIIMPKGNLRTWRQLIAKAKSFEKENHCVAGFASLCATNVYFPDKVEELRIPKGSHPSYMHMLNHAYRFYDYTAKHQHVKCLHNTQHILTLHNHYPLAYAEKSCSPFDLPTTDAQLQHYRVTETKEKQVEMNRKIIKDGNLQRFRKTLIQSCTKTLRELKFIN